MSASTRIVVFVAALASAFGVTGSPAGAVMWHNTGSTSFAGSGTPMTLSVGANNFACTTTYASGTAPASSASANYVIAGQMTWSMCTMAGQATNADCSYTFNGSAFSAGVTSGSFAVTCDVHLDANPDLSICHVSGSTPGTYTNPSGSVRGKYTFAASSTLVVSNGDTATIGGMTTRTPCLVGTGSGTLTEFTITVTNGSPTALGPVLNRTA